MSRYLLEKKADDSVLLILIIRIMDALGNYGKVLIVLATLRVFIFGPTPIRISS